MPVTRVERVDDELGYGEVPGTEAFKMRRQDAVPDEIDIVPEGTSRHSDETVTSEQAESKPAGSSAVQRSIEQRAQEGQAAVNEREPGK